LALAGPPFFPPRCPRRAMYESLCSLFDTSESPLVLMIHIIEGIRSSRGSE
jgi:hypothetical protein